KAVDLGLVEQQEEGAEAADAVVGALSVQPRVGDAGGLQSGHAIAGVRPQIVQGAELNRFCRAGLRARRLRPNLQSVITERALPHPAVAFALLDDTERAGWNAVTAAVADVLLHDDRTEFSAEQRPGGA